LGIQRSGKDIVGRFVNVDGHEMKLLPPNSVGTQHRSDVIELGMLLEASGTKSLDMIENGDDETLRSKGTILMVIYDYTNKVDFNTSRFEYTISVQRVKGTEFELEEYQYFEFPTKYTHWQI